MRDRKLLAARLFRSGAVQLTLTTALAIGVDEGVDENAMHPSARIGTGLETIPEGPGAHDGVLDQVVRLIEAAGQTTRGLTQARDVSSHLGFEGLLCARCVLAVHASCSWRPRPRAKVLASSGALFCNASARP